MDTEKMMMEGFLIGINMLREIMYPIITPMLFGMCMLIIIKKIICKLTFEFSYISGATKKEARKNAKRVESLIDLVSISNDISHFNKK